jgi:hypothetical protein
MRNFKVTRNFRVTKDLRLRQRLTRVILCKGYAEQVFCASISIIMYVITRNTAP